MSNTLSPALPNTSATLWSSALHEESAYASSEWPTCMTIFCSDGVSLLKVSLEISSGSNMYQKL